MDNKVTVELLATAVKLAILSGVSYWTILWLLKKIDPTNNVQKQKAKEKAERQLHKMGINNQNFTEYELLIASQLILPRDMTVNWKDIAGLDNIIEDITEAVIFPIKEKWILTKSKLAKPPKGVLLHGPPGCGKTMVAKAVAKEAVTSFINLDVSMLTDKWYGESQKLVSALFSLAEKIQPCIIFIDEIDSLLRSRSSQDHEATAMMKAQFMFLWDGLSTDSEKTVIVMGATNRPQDLDAAIRRRMPASYYIPMPGVQQRKEILSKILKEEETEGVDFGELACQTEEYSGSDLWELCRQAVLYCVRDCAKDAEHIRDDDIEKKKHLRLRPVNMEDIKKAVTCMNNSKLSIY